MRPHTITRLILIRHCESHANSEGRLEGSGGDSALTDVGLGQAAQLAAAIAAEEGLGRVALFSSQQVRARETARAIEAALDAVCAADPRLCEGHAGAMEGVRYDDLKEFFNAGDHGGESDEVISARMRGALEDLFGHEADTLIVVSHGYSIRRALLAFGWEGPEAPLGNGDRIVCVWDDAGVSVSHLPLA
jgi:broad specificity phosphatase PhoE